MQAQIADCKDQVLFVARRSGQVLVPRLAFDLWKGLSGGARIRADPRLYATGLLGQSRRTFEQDEHSMQHGVSCRRSNYLALMILAGTTGFGYISLEPQPAGAHLAAHRTMRDLVKLLPSGPSSPADSNASAAAVAASPMIEGKLALIMSTALLEDGRQQLLKHPSYTATFLKQEKIGKKPLDRLQTIDLKLRHEPFSVYMKWVTVKEGQEVLYVDGELNNRMLVKKGGRVGNMLPSIKLAPDSSLALAESRHPVTDAGLLKLTDKLLGYRKTDLLRSEKLKCKLLLGQSIANRPCYCFEITYDNAEVEPLYRKSITWIDQEWSIPLCVKNYTWESSTSSNVDIPQATEEVVEETEEVVEETTEELVEETEEESEQIADAGPPEDPTLIEFYTYTDIHFEKHPPPDSFDSANAEYSFKKR